MLAKISNSECFGLVKWAVGLLLISGFSLGGCSDDPQDDLTKAIHDRKSHVDLNRTGISNPYVVISAEVTKSGINPVASLLILGSKKTNSSFADLHVVSYANGKPVEDYFVQDPRFSMVEDGPLREAEKAEFRIYIPLSADIKRVTVLPVPGRNGKVSAGVDFNPERFMIEACENAARKKRNAFFPSCDAIMNRARLRVQPN